MISKHNLNQDIELGREVPTILLVSRTLDYQTDTSDTDNPIEEISNDYKNLSLLNLSNIQKSTLSGIFSRLYFSNLIKSNQINFTDMYQNNKRATEKSRISFVLGHSSEGCIVEDSPLSLYHGSLSEIYSSYMKSMAYDRIATTNKLYSLGNVETDRLQSEYKACGDRGFWLREQTLIFLNKLKSKKMKSLSLEKFSLGHNQTGKHHEQNLSIVTILLCSVNLESR